MMWVLIYVAGALAWQNVCTALRVSAVRRGTVKPEAFGGELALAWINSALWPITAPVTGWLTVRRVWRMWRMRDLRLDGPLPPELEAELKRWRSVGR